MEACYASLMSKTAIPTRDRILRSRDQAVLRRGHPRGERRCRGRKGRRHQADVLLSLPQQGRPDRRLSRGARSAELCAVSSAGSPRPMAIWRTRWRASSAISRRSVRHPKWKGCGFLRTSVRIGQPAGPSGHRDRRARTRSASRTGCMACSRKPASARPRGNWHGRSSCCWTAPLPSCCCIATRAIWRRQARGAANLIRAAVKG